MNYPKTKSSLYAQGSHFLHPDEYEVVSSYDLVLMTDTNYSPRLEPNEGADCSLHSQIAINSLSYEEEWGEFFKKGEIDLEQLKERSAEGKLKCSHFRSVYWRILLGILHKQPIQWLCQLHTYRKHYSDVLAEIDHNPWSESIPSDNPLSQESASVWQKYFCDEELKSVILQDVERTFPDLNYFRQDEVQKIMVRILFCYARQNPVLCYKQGMHEILAPLILVLQADHQAFQTAVKQNPEIEKTISDVLSPEFLEHDAYSLFKHVMNHIQYSYRIKSKKEENKTDENEIISRLEFIKKNLLIQTDGELCSHLENLNIPLHLFGIRWLRLLFGREFNLLDLLVLWDFIFAINFECVNHLVVAMLVAIRHILLKGDYNSCLSTLMKYPVGVNVSWIIAYAQHLRDPVKYSAPTMNQSDSSVKSSQSNESQTRKRPVKRSNKPGKWFSTYESLLGQRKGGQDGEVIVQDFVVNDANFPKDELEQIKVVLSSVHHKLMEFHTLLRTRLKDNNNPDVELVINGIYEISCLLKNYDTCEIETACEAGESKEQDDSAQSPDSRKSQPENEASPESAISSDKKSHTLPRTKKSIKSGELKVFKRQRGGESIVGAPMTDPLRLIRNSQVFGE